MAAGLSRSKSPAVGVRADPEWHRKVMDHVPIGRYDTPDDLRGTVIFLASAASDYISGGDAAG